ncbi:Bestrophin, RFP-TM, chloride channel [Posidoniimonas polymericola]|uniref:Bestrophin, RFP-TM, chloride channel n=1 Tax=Posidoniimonas polymericola TaxID=2528002 RepID=A0A5C5YS80_9BACT|nr:bestrophin family ion channel [Posidoniimonas polymericola]TWT77748.1 Bestrophin, RFP-TM, chloride channel [Posidoniimonas polymericola]
MIVSRSIKWRHVLFYTWKSMLYFAVLSVVAYVLHHKFDMERLTVPFNAIATLSTALAIFLGFKNNSAYDRWWEARKIWGMLVNYSRAWGREVMTLAVDPVGDEPEEMWNWQRSLVYRHIAFVHALRVNLRERHPYNEIEEELFETLNHFDEIRPFLTEDEFDEVVHKRNAPNYLLMNQGRDLKHGYERGWLSDYRYVRLGETLNEFHNHQGMSERIKNTPFPRPYSFFSRVFVFLHGTLVPFAFIEDLGLFNIPLSLLINFVFLSLDQIGERTEDPFENRPDDTPLTAISLTIEENLKEMIGDENLPIKPPPVEGVVF